MGLETGRDDVSEEHDDIPTDPDGSPEQTTPTDAAAPPRGDAAPTPPAEGDGALLTTGADRDDGVGDEAVDGALEGGEAEIEAGEGEAAADDGVEAAPGEVGADALEVAEVEAVEASGGLGDEGEGDAEEDDAPLAPPDEPGVPEWGWGFPRWEWREHALPFAILAVVHAVTAAVFLFNDAPGTDAALTGFPLDDSWIHLVYSRALSSFQGFAYNPGQPETGATSPLWALFLAPLFWLKPLWGGSIVAGVKGVGLLVGWLVSVIAFRLGERLTGHQAVGYAAGLMIALDPFMAFAKMSGMEVMFFAGIGLYLVWSLAERRLGGVALALALLPVARPEGVVIWGLSAGCVGLLLLTQVRRWWAWPAVFAPTLLTAGSWVGYCYAITGKPLPATYYAKRSHHKGLWDEANMKSIWMMITDLPWLYYGVGAGFALLGAALLLWPPRGRRRRLDQWALRATLVVYPPLFTYALSRVHVFQQHWPFYWNRYFQPVLPAFYLLIAVGFGTLCVRAWGLLRDRERRAWGGVAVAALALSLIAPSIGLYKETRRLSDLYASNCENINEMNVAVGRWLKEHVPEGEWIALNDAGAIRFFSERSAIDLLGLNNHEVLFGGRSRVVKEHDPQYFAIFPNWFEHKYAKSQRYERAFEVKAKHYTICNCAQDVKTVFKMRSKEELREHMKEIHRQRRQERLDRLKEKRRRDKRRRDAEREEEERKEREAKGDEAPSGAGERRVTPPALKINVPKLPKPPASP